MNDFVHPSLRSCEPDRLSPRCCRLLEALYDGGGAINDRVMQRIRKGKTLKLSVEEVLLECKADELKDIRRHRDQNQGDLWSIVDAKSRNLIRRIDRTIASGIIR